MMPRSGRWQLYSQLRGNVPRCGYRHDFTPCIGAAYDLDPRFGYRKLRGNKLHQSGISLTLHRWRLDADFQTAAVLSGEFTAMGIGLQVALQPQCLSLPVIKHDDGLIGLDTDNVIGRQSDALRHGVQYDFQHIDRQEHENR